MSFLLLIDCQVPWRKMLQRAASWAHQIHQCCYRGLQQVALCVQGANVSKYFPFSMICYSLYFHVFWESYHSASSCLINPAFLLVGHILLLTCWTLLPNCLITLSKMLCGSLDAKPWQGLSIVRLMVIFLYVFLKNTKITKMITSLWICKLCRYFSMIIPYLLMDVENFL